MKLGEIMYKENRQGAPGDQPKDENKPEKGAKAKDSKEDNEDVVDADLKKLKKIKKRKVISSILFGYLNEGLL